MLYSGSRSCLAADSPQIAVSRLSCQILTWPPLFSNITLKTIKGLDTSAALSMGPQTCVPQWRICSQPPGLHGHEGSSLPAQLDLAFSRKKPTGKAEILVKGKGQGPVCEKTFVASNSVGAFPLGKQVMLECPSSGFHGVTPE